MTRLCLICLACGLLVGKAFAHESKFDYESANDLIQKLDCENVGSHLNPNMDYLRPFMKHLAEVFTGRVFDTEASMQEFMDDESSMPELDLTILLTMVTTKHMKCDGVL